MDEQQLAEIEAAHQPLSATWPECRTCTDGTGVAHAPYPCAPARLVARVRALEALRDKLLWDVAAERTEKQQLQEEVKRLENDWEPARDY